MHATVASKKVAAHAEGEAVGVVLAKELGGGDGGELGHGGAVPLVVHQALGLVKVRQER